MFLIHPCCLLSCMFCVQAIPTLFPPHPLKLLGKTFVSINDTGNSDVKIYAMKHRSSPKQILLVVCAICFTASCVSIFKHFFFLSSLSRLRNQLPCVFTTMDNADRISLSREPSKSAKVLLTVSFIRCSIISFVLKRGSAQTQLAQLARFLMRPGSRNRTLAKLISFVSFCSHPLFLNLIELFYKFVLLFTTGTQQERKWIRNNLPLLVNKQHPSPPKKKTENKQASKQKLTNNDFVYEVQHIITMVNYFSKNL